MAMKRTMFTVTPKQLAAYQLDVGFETVPLVNGKCWLMLEEDDTHTAVWRMRGNPGGAIGITFTDRTGAEKVLVKESKIRQGKLSGFGIKDFAI